MDQSVSTTTPVRDLAMDFYRVVAIALVVLGHWLVAALTYRNGQFGRTDRLSSCHGRSG